MKRVRETARAGLPATVLSVVPVIGAATASPRGPRSRQILPAKDGS